MHTPALLMSVFFFFLLAIGGKAQATPPQHELAKSDSLSLSDIPTPLHEATNSTTSEGLRRKQSVWMLGVGGLLANDSYLSPLNYGGWAYSVSAEQSSRLGYKSHKWILHLASNLELGTMENPAGNAKMYSLLLDLDASALYRVALAREGFAKGLRLDLGPGIALGLGGLYSNRNGNNPGTLKCYTHTIGTLRLGYHTELKQWPLYFQLSLQNNLFGLGFGQDYAESYYEQFLLKDKLQGAINFTHPGKLWRMHTALSVDMPLWNLATLRLGYRLDSYQGRIKGIKSNTLSQRIVIGLVTDFYSLRGKRALRNPANKLDYSPYYHQRP